MPDSAKKSEDKKKEDITAEDLSTFGKVALFFLEVIKIAVIAGITIALVRYFLFKPFYVKGQSMEPTFYAKEYLIVDELSYRFSEPERGDVIVFRSPVSPKEFYLKRIIGVPGERVKVEGKKVIVFNEEFPQGKVIDESYLVEETPGETAVTLGLGEYFVLGDNRDASFDSRRFGAIHESDIVGKTWFRGWPFNRISTFSPPEYNL
jgi:signal peptidase I